MGWTSHCPQGKLTNEFPEPPSAFLSYLDKHLFDPVQLTIPNLSQQQVQPRHQNSIPSSAARSRPGAGGKQSTGRINPHPHLGVSSPLKKVPLCQAPFLLGKLFSAVGCIRCQATVSASHLSWIRLLQRNRLNYSFKAGLVMFNFLTRAHSRKPLTAPSWQSPTRGWSILSRDGHGREGRASSSSQKTIDFSIRLRIDQCRPG